MRNPEASFPFSRYDILYIYIYIKTLPHMVQVSQAAHKESVTFTFILSGAGMIIMELSETI